MQMQTQMQILPQVGFCEAIKLGFKNYAKCNGRSRRSEFWFFQLFIYLIGLPLYVIMNAMTPTNNYSSSSNYENYYLVVGLFLVFILVIAIPQISVSVRRLHDTGKSGLFYFVSFIPFVGGFILLYLCSVDSGQNNNEYGPSPKYILPQNDPLNPNNNAYGVPVNPNPQPNQMQPQVNPYH